MQRKWIKIWIKLCFVMIMLGSTIINLTVIAFANQTAQVSDFTMQSDWVQRNSNWFSYQNGNRRIGWIHVPASNGSSVLNWFYLETDGRMGSVRDRVPISDLDSISGEFYFEIDMHASDGRQNDYVWWWLFPLRR